MLADQQQGRPSNARAASLSSEPIGTAVRRNAITCFSTASVSRPAAAMTAGLLSAFPDLAGDAAPALSYISLRTVRVEPACGIDFRGCHPARRAHLLADVVMLTPVAKLGAQMDRASSAIPRRPCCRVAVTGCQARSASARHWAALRYWRDAIALRQIGVIRGESRISVSLRLATRASRACARVFSR